MSMIGSRRLKTITVFFCAIGLTYSISIKKEIMCYVCTSNSDNIEYNMDFDNTFSKDEIVNIPTCGTNSASTFKLKCPDGYKGCLTTIHGKNVIKSCAKYSINDCKIANTVTYCFCAGSLCNDRTILTPIPLQTDDEDSDPYTEDGSGQFDDKIQSNEHKYTRQTKTVVLNNITLNNISIATSAGKSWLPKNINILNLIFIIYNGGTYK